MIDRRLTFVVISALLAASLAAEAQPPKNVRIGYLSSNPPSDTKDAIDAFRTKLGALGYLEGQNLLIESRYAEGRQERLPQLAAELVRLKVDVLFTYSTPGALAAKNATSSIPIVFAGVSDPLIVGLVATLARPGGNVTGVTLNNPELSAKRLSLVKEAVPAASRVAILANPDFKPSSSMVAEMRPAARALRVEIQVLEVREPHELAQAFGAMVAAKLTPLSLCRIPCSLLNGDGSRSLPRGVACPRCTICGNLWRPAASPFTGQTMWKHFNRAPCWWTRS
jgi:ABC-type uncharacterized transport system substrate-binding protein